MIELINLTANEVERLLATDEYKTREYKFSRFELDALGGTSEGYHEARECNSITALADLFEDLIQELGTLPTQKQYVERGVEIAEKWWAKNKTSKWEAGMMFSFNYRLAQSYKSHVIEMHTQLKLQEMFPTAKVYSHDYLDYGLAVDIMMDYNGRRYSIHILKDSVKSRNYYNQKEKRTGFYINGKWHKYKRDFTGHLKFEYDLKNKDKCKNINGIPLFKDEYISISILLAEIEGKGEEINGETQLDKFVSWLKDNCLVNTNFSFC